MGNWTQEQKDDFDIKVFKVLSAMLSDEFSPERPIEELQGSQKSYVSQWLASGAKDSTFETVGDALIDFQRYISKHHIRYGQAKEEYVEMCVTVDYGQAGGVISWKLGSQFEVSSPNDRLNAQATIWQAIGQMRDDFERKTMLRIKTDNVENTQQSNSFEEIACGRLIVDVKDGKVAYKIKGGKFEKWGVRVFPETLSKININVDTIPLNGVDLTGYSMTVLMKGRNPDKVTKLVPVG